MSIDRFLATFFDPAMITRYWPMIIEGMALTALLAAAIVVCGGVLGLLLACLRSRRWPAINFFIVLFADFWRALPPLVPILLLYFGLPNAGLELSAFTVLWLTLSLVLAAFVEEACWAGIRAIRPGQWEAARSSGMGFVQTLCWVILPQALRIALPSLTNRAIAITKMTALGTVIGVPEILNQASSAQAFSGSATPLTLGALAYLAIFLPLVVLSRWAESRLAWKRG
ncbi:amino acid ABC transporter permease [Halotalea alkalilenta]|uniref:amino acid ABC transporter permease n=1 Tax=Halotalea alkalilenta TaxID=376489 RepID=UPI0009EE55B4|nr:ABC transporter permease subunit [Halotalea alkalilenta]